MIVRFSAALVFVATVGASYAQEPPLGRGALNHLPMVVQRAILQQRSLRYSGTRIVFNPKNARAPLELVIRDGLRLRMQRANAKKGEGPVVIVNEKGAYRWFPKKNIVEEMNPAVGHLAGEFLLGQILRQRLTIDISPGPTIAGFATQLATVKNPKGEVLRRVAIEPGSGAVVKVEVFKGGIQTGGFEFQSIDFRPAIAADAFQINAPTAKVVTLNEKFRDLALKNGFRPIFLRDSGVKLQNVKFLKEGNQPVMQQIYSSPKGVVSLFQMRGDFNAKKFTDASQGKVNAYSWKADGSTYVIVAGQPRKSITALAAQVGGQ